MSTLRSAAFPITILAALVIAAVALLGATAARGQEAGTPAATPAATLAPGADGVLRFDVAEDGTRFVFQAEPVHEDGMPAYGNPFVTQGYIYPAGTLDGTNGVLADGSPEFPEKVLGTWTCRGWMIGDGMHTTTGPVVITTQLYAFGAGAGDATMVTDGYELADVGVVVERAITGGTGAYTGAEGVARQTLLGLNATQGVNLRYEVDTEA